MSVCQVHGKKSAATIRRDRQRAAQRNQNQQPRNENVENGKDCCDENEERQRDKRKRQESFERVPGAVGGSSDTEMTEVEREKQKQKINRTDLRSKIIEAENRMYDNHCVDLKSMREKVKKHVNEKKQVLNVNRNSVFKRVLCQRRAGKNTLYGISEDFRLEYDNEMCQTTAFGFLSDSPSPSSFTLARGDDFGEEIDHMTSDFHAFCDLIRLYMLETPG